MCVEDEPGVASWMHAYKSKANTINLKYAWGEMMEAGSYLGCLTSINGHAHLTLVTSVRRRNIGKGGRGIRELLAAWYIVRAFLADRLACWQLGRNQLDCEACVGICGQLGNNVQASKWRR